MSNFDRVRRMFVGGIEYFDLEDLIRFYEVEHTTVEVWAAYALSVKGLIRMVSCCSS
jgi:hypothetical protein